MKHVVIIGNGIAGITAARHIRKLSNHEITVISAESEHFFSRTALMYIYMGHMKYEHTKPYEDWFWAKNRINLLRAFVSKVDTEGKTLLLDSGKKINYDVLIIASGSRSNKFGWQGQDLPGVQGLYHLQDLELMYLNSEGIKNAAIVGGGLIGVEMAEMLLSRKIKVSILAREKYFWNNVLPDEEARLIGRHIIDHGVDLKLETELKGIHPDQAGRAGTVSTSKGETIPAELVGLTAGVSPNIAFLNQSGLKINGGVVVNEYLGTNVRDVYAIGDCAEVENPLPGRRAIEPVWYTGRMMGETVALTICGKPTRYNPGIWFNSAKFFDIEYQVYGDVPNTESMNGTGTFYWEHPSGRKSFRINYNKKGGNVTGINVLGIRIRHELCQNWIKQKIAVTQAMKSLEKASFEPEFSGNVFKEIKEAYSKLNAIKK